MRRSLTPLPAMLLGLALVPGGLMGQLPGEATDVHLRNDCRLAAQILTFGNPQPHYGWALETIPRCDLSAGSALASLWSNPPQEPAELDRIVLASVEIRDLRIQGAVEAAAADSARPVLVRLAALRVLAGYVDASVRASFDDLAPDSSTRFGLGIQMDHVAVNQGSEPLSTSAPFDILDFLRELVRADPSPEIRAAAEQIVRVCTRTTDNPPTCH